MAGFGTALTEAHPTPTNLLEPRRLHRKHHVWTYGNVILPEPTTSSASSPSATGLCPSGNGTTFKSDESNTYQVICDIDFTDNDYPFKLVHSFENCVHACDDYNADAGKKKCVAALFVPSRLNGLDDCYLKSSVDNPSAATVGIEGAILLTETRAATKTTLAPTSASSLLSSESPSPTSVVPIISDQGITYALGNSVVEPKVAGSMLHGPSQNEPSDQYLDVNSPKVPALSKDLLVPGVNGDLTTGYGISPDTGYLQINASTESLLTPLKNKPHLSRDGGRGGYLDGQHLFIFSDTGSYSTTTSTTKGKFLGFVSSSVAVDKGMNGLNSEPLNLQDGIGAWSDDVGRMRGLAPMTQGEQGYNLVMQGHGKRYAVWPQSSIISLNAKTALIYAPIIYDDVNQDTKAAVFTYTGSTLLSLTIAGKGGPIAVRETDRIFDQDEIEWGCAGGIRSWGPSGVGGNDGKVYIFGNIKDGMLLARVSPNKVADRNSVGLFIYYWIISDKRSMSTGTVIPGARTCWILHRRHSSLLGVLL